MNILFLCPAAAVPTRGPRPQTWSGRARVHAEVRARDSWRERSSGSSFPSPLYRVSRLMDTEVERPPSNVGRPHPRPRRERFRPSPRLRARVSPGPVLPPCAAVPCHGDPPGPGRGRVTAPVTAPAWHPTPASPSRLTGLAGGAELRAGRVRKGSTLRPAPGPGPLRTPHPGKAYGSLLPSSHSPAPRWPRLGPQHGTAACRAPLMPAWRDPGAARQDGGAAQVKAPCHHCPPCQEPGGEQEPGRAWELLLEPP